MTDQLVKDNERIDDLQNGYYVIQDPDKFCFGMDAVLLSGFAKVKKGETALDLGTGTGIVPILLKTKTNGKHFTGLEIQKECADMAGRSVRYNHLEDDVEIVQGDIKEAADIFGAASFDVVTSNPPDYRVLHVWQLLLAYPDCEVHAVRSYKADYLSLHQKKLPQKYQQPP